MKWSGFFVIFLAVYVFSNFIYTVRLDYTSKNALVEQRFPLPDSTLQIMGRPGVLSAQTMPKQPLILFFFASWCRPCLIELPTIVAVSERHDVPFIGIAVRDTPEKAEAFLKKTGNPYQIIALDPKNTWTADMRADKLPTAFILNEKSEVVAKIRGIITEEFYLKTIVPFLRELKK